MVNIVFGADMSNECDQYMYSTCIRSVMLKLTAASLDSVSRAFTAVWTRSVHNSVSGSVLLVIVGHKTTCMQGVWQPN